MSVQLRYNAWIKQVNLKVIEVAALLKRHAQGPSSVSRAEWKYVARGTQYKQVAIMRAHRDRHPAAEQYPWWYALLKYYAKGNTNTGGITVEEQRRDEETRRRLDEERERRTHEWVMDWRTLWMEKARRRHQESVGLQCEPFESLDEKDTWLQRWTRRHRMQKEKEKDDEGDLESEQHKGEEHL